MSKRQKIWQKGSGRQRSGFTLIELLIAVLLAAIVTSAATALYITQHKQLIVQDEISDMQASIRAAAAELTSKIRMAGYNVPDGIPALEAHNTNPDMIVITYDTGDIQNVQIEFPMPLPSSELRCDGHDLSGLNDGDWAYIYDPNTQTGEFFLITEVQYASSHIQHNTMPLSKAYPQGSMVIKMNQFKYFIDQTDPAHPNLMIELPGRAPQVFAENISDLQFSYVLSDSTTVDEPADASMVREVIITLNARTDKPDDEFFTQYRTRTLTTRAMLRNLGNG